MTWEQQYLDVLQELVQKDGWKENRTRARTKYLFDRSIRVDHIEESFPLLTTKKVFYRGVVEELLFFLRGETDTKKLEEKGIFIWKGNTERSFLDQHGSSHVQQFPEGLMGPGYSWQFRSFGAPYEYRDKNVDHKYCSFGSVDFDSDAADALTDRRQKYSSGFDQVAHVLECLKTKPTRRDMVISLWNPLQHKDAVLPPCHVLYVFSYEPETHTLHLSMTQRSCDFFLGVPFNIASMATFLQIMAKAAGMKAGSIAWHGVDVHLYENQIDAATQQLQRSVLDAPKLTITKDISTVQDIESLAWEDFVVDGYEPHPTIKADMVA